MPTDQRLVRLPDDLLRRFRRIVPARARSAFVRQSLEKALPSEDDDNDKLYLAALGAERDTRLSAEMAAWEEDTAGDRFKRGCGQPSAPDRHGRAALDWACAAAACHRVGSVRRS